MYNIAICDDSEEYGEIVTEFVQRAALGIGISCNLFTFNSGRNLVQACEGNNFDIIFLDMEMPEQNGIETGLLIREISSEAVIFYITSHKEYAYDSYKVKARDYLLKPVTVSALEKVLLEHIEDKEKKEKKEEVMLLDVKDINGVLHRIPLHEITHVLRKKEDRKLHIYRLSKEEIILVQTLDSIEKKLMYSSIFARAGKSCLVNLDNVRTINKNVIHFSNDVQEEASRRCLSELLNRFKIRKLAVKM